MLVLPVTMKESFFSAHGRISNIPAEEVSATSYWENDNLNIEIKGKIREARFFGENLVMERTIRCNLFENKLYIENKIENNGFKSEKLMLLFHFNIGYPVLDEDTELILPVQQTKPRDRDAKKGINMFTSFHKPEADYKEQVFYHQLSGDDKNNTQVKILNRKLKTGLSIGFNLDQLPLFTQWKQMGMGEYVLGLEPCNCYVGGRTDPKNRKLLNYIEPGEIRNFNICIELTDID